MKKFSFGLMALALFAAPAFADEPAATGGAEPAPVVCDLPVVAVHDCKGHDPEVCADANVVMTMTAIPEGGEGAENVDPTLMYMTGIPTDVPMMTQRGEGENFRNLSDVHTMNAASVTATSRFEGLRQVAAERNAFGVERSGVSDRSSLKGMLFGSKADAKARRRWSPTTGPACRRWLKSTSSATKP